MLQAVWGDTSVIADVLAGHLDDIPTEQVDVLSSWRSAPTGDFAVRMRGSDEYLLGFGRAFKVYGLTQSIRGMLEPRVLRWCALRCCRWAAHVRRVPGGVPR